MYFIAEENFVRKIAFHHLLLKHPSSIYDVVNSQLASVVAWAGLYMDVGGDLNAKYAIMCHKTVLIPENDKESAMLSPTIAVLSVEQDKRWCTGLSIFFTILPIACVVGRLCKPQVSISFMRCVSDAFPSMSSFLLQMSNSSPILLKPRNGKHFRKGVESRLKVRKYKAKTETNYWETLLLVNSLLFLVFFFYFLKSAYTKKRIL